MLEEARGNVDEAANNYEQMLSFGQRSIGAYHRHSPESRLLRHAGVRLLQKAPVRRSHRTIPQNHCRKPAGQAIPFIWREHYMTTVRHNARGT